METERFYQLLGLATRARKVVSGERTVVQNIRNRQASLVLLSSDASKNSLKTVTDKCTYYDVPYRIVGTREQLGRAIGQPSRVVVAVLDQSFAKTMKQLLDE